MAKAGYGHIHDRGQAVDFHVCCSNDPSGRGEMVFALTIEMTKNRKGIVPHKVCTRCLRSFPVIAFIKHQVMAVINGRQFSLISDSELCHNCQPPPVFHFHFAVNGKLMMRLELHHDNGELVQIWDPSTTTWGPLRFRGLRRMTSSKDPDSNVVRFQPRSDRSHHAETGFTYGHGPLLPLDDLDG